ncbi:hypothetical protein JMJ06_000209 [Enterococcus faecalis]|nr:hypothetical protein [Enterococcus faecalis]
MFEVQILDTNTRIFNKKNYAYVEFDELSEQMMELDWVVFLIVRRKKEFYKGKFIRYQQTAHQDIQSKIMNLVEKRQIKEKKAVKFLSQLDQEFQMAINTSKKEKNFLKFFPMPSKKVILTLVTIGSILFITIGGIVFLTDYYTQSLSQQQINEQRNFNELLSEEQYLRAAELFPDQLIEIEDMLLEKNDFNQLAKFQEKYPTTEGAFDLAYHQQEWQKVISFDSATLTDKRKSMLAIAYLELNQFEEAEILNNHLQSEQIENQIKKAKFSNAVSSIQNGDIQQAEAIQENLQDNRLVELIDTAKVCQEMITFYQERKDSDNEDVWKNRLMNLGKAWLTSEKTEEQ